MTTLFMTSSSEISSKWRENFAELFSIVYHASGSAIQVEVHYTIIRSCTLQGCCQSSGAISYRRRFREIRRPNVALTI